MSSTLLMPPPTDSWVQGICRRFSQATGWPLVYESTLKDALGVSPQVEDRVIWQTELHSDNGLSGRLVLRRTEDSPRDDDLPRILALSELLAELVSHAEVAQWELACRSQELAALVDVGRVVSKEEGLTSSLNRLVRAAVQLTGFRSSAFFLLGPAGEQFQLKAEFHQEGQSIPFPKRDLPMEPPDFSLFQEERVLLRADASPLEAIWLPQGIATGAGLGVRLEEEPLGTLWAYDRRNREPEIREWHVLESICAQIAGVFERTVLKHESSTEHRLRHDCRVASEHQQRRLFDNLDPEARIEVAGFCTSRFELGGDLCEAISLDPHRTVIVLGDACGDSVPAAMVMSSVRGAVHSLVSSLKDEALQTEPMTRRLNRTLHAVTPAHQFMSLIYLVIDTEKQLLSYTNAGHPAPVLLHEGEVRELESHGMLAGILEDAAYGSDTLPISPNDLLVLFSDGITEAMSDSSKMFRARGIMDTVKDHQNETARQVADAITDRLKAHTGGIDDDDRTLAVIRF